MLSAFPYDVPQAFPAPPPPYPQHQRPEWYEHPQMMTWSTDVALEPVDVRSRGGNLQSQDNPYEQILPTRELARQIRSLQQHYTIVDRNDLIIEILGEQPALYAILIEAVAPLQRAFGDRRIIQLRAKFSEDDSLLKVAVQLPADLRDPERALHTFDENWWLENCHRSGGALVFDYEIQDAV